PGERGLECPAGWTSRKKKVVAGVCGLQTRIRRQDARMGEGHQSGESARMALDIHTVKELEEHKTEIAIEPKAPLALLQQSSALKPGQKSPAAKSAKPAEEPSSGDGSVGISLIDLAEMLDQHKQWVESGGESGARADLTGVNLSKADLTGVNLQAA